MPARRRVRAGRKKGGTKQHEETRIAAWPAMARRFIDCLFRAQGRSLQRLARRELRLRKNRTACARGSQCFLCGRTTEYLQTTNSRGPLSKTAGATRWKASQGFRFVGDVSQILQTRKQESGLATRNGTRPD